MIALFSSAQKPDVESQRDETSGSVPTAACALYFSFPPAPLRYLSSRVDRKSRRMGTSL